jgi:hypothetical protein
MELLVKAARPEPRVPTARPALRAQKATEAERETANSKYPGMDVSEAQHAGLTPAWGIPGCYSVISLLIFSTTTKVMSSVCGVP